MAAAEAVRWDYMTQLPFTPTPTPGEENDHPTATTHVTVHPTRHLQDVADGEVEEIVQHEDEDAEGTALLDAAGFKVRQ